MGFVIKFIKYPVCLDKNPPSIDEKLQSILDSKIWLSRPRFFNDYNENIFERNVCASAISEIANSEQKIINEKYKKVFGANAKLLYKMIEEVVIPGTIDPSKVCPEEIPFLNDLFYEPQSGNGFIFPGNNRDQMKDKYRIKRYLDNEQFNFPRTKLSLLCEAISYKYLIFSASKLDVMQDECMDIMLSHYGGYDRAVALLYEIKEESRPIDVTYGNYGHKCSDEYLSYFLTRDGFIQSRVKPLPSGRGYKRHWRSQSMR